MSLTVAAAGASKLFSSRSFSFCLRAAAALNSKPRGNKLMSSPKPFLTTPNLTSNSGVKKKFCAIRASNSQGQEEEAEESPSNSFSQEDVAYLLKLGAGSVAGAAVIKFGSILYPEITRPNLLQALIMISMPMVLAVVLLINQTQSE